MNVGTLLLNMSARYASRAALHDGDRTLTYRELHIRTNRLASALVARYVLQRGDRVATLCHNRLEIAEMMYGSAKSGGVYVGMNFRLKRADLAGILDNCKPRLIVAGAEFMAQAQELGEEQSIPVLGLDDIGPDGYEALIASGSAENPPWLSEIDGDDDFLITYTSGTTGRPKGLLFTHQAMMHIGVVWALEYGYSAQSRLLLCLPHYGAPQTSLLPIHSVGGSVRFFDNRSFSGQTFCELVDRYRITETYLVPTQIYRILDHLETDPTDLPSMRIFGYGAAPIAPSRLEAIVKRLGPRFQQLYGMLEAGGLMTQLRVEDHERAAAGEPHLFASAGQASFLVAVRTVDAQGNDTPIGEPGEVIFWSPYAMKEYNADPERTAETVRGGWVYSGDVGRYDEEGYLYIVDRIKDLIIRGGHNIAPREIEDRIHGHQLVDEVAVIGVPDVDWGETVVAVVVPRDGAAIVLEEIRAWCREGGLSSIMLPDRMVLRADPLPKNLIGKIDKRQVREFVAAAV
jgi:acyl-CoA synthetase (AMP-forming)/AMP-acid ligase II